MAKNSPHFAMRVARGRCPKCRHEMFVAFSCRGRCVCPSCHEKGALEKAGWVAEHVCAEVPHRHFVFTIPKRLGLYFRYDRWLLGTLCQAAWRTVCTVDQATSSRPDSVPGMVGAIQTFGDLMHWHRHIHVLVSDGVFLPDGTFLPLPKLASEPFLKQVYETDPLVCSKCGSEMKIIAFNERDQDEVIEKILRHCGLWEETPYFHRFPQHLKGFILVATPRNGYARP